jgi:hypothetical protein
MHIAKNQSAPFEFEGRNDDPEVYDMLSHLTTAGYDPGNVAVSPIFALITFPKDGDTFAAGDSMMIRASGTGTQSVDGAYLEIFANDVLIGKIDTAPWRIRWENVGPNTYDLVAVLRDRQGIERPRSRMVDFVVT